MFYKTSLPLKTVFKPRLWTLIATKKWYQVAKSLVTHGIFNVDQKFQGKEQWIIINSRIRLG